MIRTPLFNANALNDALIKASQKVLGKKPRTKQLSWVSNTMLQLISEEGELKAKFKRIHKPKDKEAWKAIQAEVTK